MKEFSTMVLRSMLFAGFLIICGCSINQRHSDPHHTLLGLSADDLRSCCVAMITPSSVTGQEEDRQALALSFAAALQKHRPDIQFLGLPQTLSAINQNGTADIYRAMYDEYQNTGIFNHQALAQLSKATNCRYILQLKLADFRQSSDGRFGVLGLRVLTTRQSNLRLFAQIWDSQTGAIVWEASDELSMATEAFRQINITFTDIVEAGSAELISTLPK